MPSLNALPVHRANQVHFFVFSGSFFGVRFLCVFLEALGDPLGAIGSILGAFGEHLGLILVTFSG